MMRCAIVSVLLAGGLSAAGVVYDGSTVHYESYGEGRDAIVFIHGWTCDLTFWRGQEPVYKKHRALLVDLPGHGQSDKPDVAYTQERFARAVEAVMTHAGVERGVLVGHSMGGPVAITFLRLFPGKVRALVLVDANIPSGTEDETLRARRKTQMEGVARSLREPNYKEISLKMIESMFSGRTTATQRDEIRSKMTATPQHVMTSAMEGMLTLQQLKPGETYSLPVLTVMAARPGRAGYEERLRSAFPNLTYEEWEGAGHFLMIESPDRFNTALEGFLARIAKK